MKNSRNHYLNRAIQEFNFLFKFVSQGGSKVPSIKNVKGEKDRHLNPFLQGTCSSLVCTNPQIETHLKEEELIKYASVKDSVQGSGAEYPGK